MTTVPLNDVKLALDLELDETDHDLELERLLTAAEAEYLEWVGSLTDLPANDAEVIVTDVAELWVRTQRHDGADRAGFDGEGGAAATGRPLVLWPRIHGLAKSRREPVSSFPDAQTWPDW